MKIQADELAEFHCLQLGGKAADRAGNIDARVGRYHAGGAVDDALRHIENSHDDVERVGDDQDGDERLEDPAKEHPCVHVVQVVFVDDHVDQLVAHDEREHHARDGDDDRFGQRLDHGEDAAVPSRRCRSYLRCNLSDLRLTVSNMPERLSVIPLMSSSLSHSVIFWMMVSIQRHHPIS